ncbi:hypothetical protein IFM89_014820 [Coptis chinensis]|uniref:Uncharacterized protein n=1 Tax=Coptis chinensis TaxID=261450 RepID=A0A835M056_9MAGN|nr:hypothetical protein IFM89_014820 [Coptis chinensis]
MEITEQSQILSDTFGDITVESSQTNVPFQLNDELDAKLNAYMNQALIASYTSHMEVLSIQATKVLLIGFTSPPPLFEDTPNAVPELTISTKSPICFAGLPPKKSIDDVFLHTGVSEENENEAFSSSRLTRDDIEIVDNEKIPYFGMNFTSLEGRKKEVKVYKSSTRIKGGLEKGIAKASKGKTDRRCSGCNQDVDDHRDDDHDGDRDGEEVEFKI